MPDLLGRTGSATGEAARGGLRGPRPRRAARCPVVDAQGAPGRGVAVLAAARCARSRRHARASSRRRPRTCASRRGRRRVVGRARVGAGVEARGSSARRWRRPGRSASGWWAPAWPAGWSAVAGRGAEADGVGVAAVRAVSSPRVATSARRRASSTPAQQRRRRQPAGAGAGRRADRGAGVAAAGGATAGRRRGGLGRAAAGPPARDLAQVERRGARRRCAGAAAAPAARRARPVGRAARRRPALGARPAAAPGRAAASSRAPGPSSSRPSSTGSSGPAATNGACSPVTTAVTVEQRLAARRTAAGPRPR